MLFHFCRDVHELVLELLQIVPNCTYTNTYVKKTTVDTLDFRSFILPKNFQQNIDPNFMDQEFSSKKEQPSE